MHAIWAVVAVAVLGCSSTKRGYDTPDGGEGGAAGSGGANSAASGGKGGGKGSIGGNAGESSGGNAGEGGGGGGSGGDAGDGGGGSGGVPACAEARISEPGTNVGSGTTAGQDDRFSPTCGTGNAGDLAFVFASPESGYYSIDTIGSNFDTVLAVYRGGCQGSEFACDNGSVSTPQGEIVTELTQGEDVLVVVEGQSGEMGNAVLNVSRVTCPEVDLTGQTFPLALTTVGGSNGHSGACQGSGNEKSYRYVPAQAGFHRFSVNTSAFAPAIYLEAGAKCGSPLLQCNRGQPDTYPVHVTRYLPAGEPVTLIVDSASGEGAFELDIERLNQTTCAEARPLPAEPNESIIDVIQSGDSHLLSASCHATGGLGPYPDAFVEHRFAINADSLNCWYDIYASGPVYASLVRGTMCEGEEVRCIESAVNTDPSYDGYSDYLYIDFTVAQLGQYVLSLETGYASGQPIDYEIVRTCVN
jgi:hypothetical protein